MSYQPMTKRPYGRAVVTKSPGAKDRGITRPPKATGKAPQQSRS